MVKKKKKKTKKETQSVYFFLWLDIHTKFPISHSGCQNT